MNNIDSRGGSPVAQQGRSDNDRSQEHERSESECNEKPSAQALDAGVPTWQERMQNYYSRGDVKLRPYEAFMKEEIEDYRARFAAGAPAETVKEELNEQH